MQELLGTEIRKGIVEELKLKVANLGHVGMAVVIVEGDSASEVYVKSILKMCKTLGIESIEKRLPNNSTQNEIIDAIQELNANKKVHGIICQVPLPKHCDEKLILSHIATNKDVDCITSHNIGLLASGSPSFIPCTPYAVLQILKRSNISTEGKNIVVVGRSNTVGRPLSILLSGKGWDGTVTVAHSKTAKLPEVCRQADILIAAIGKANFITKDFVKNGAVVIDVGINQVGEKIVGDVDYESIKEVASSATPVPGGVGPLTIAMLMQNILTAKSLQED